MNRSEGRADHAKRSKFFALSVLWLALPSTYQSSAIFIVLLIPVFITLMLAPLLLFRRRKKEEKKEPQKQEGGGESGKEIQTTKPDGEQQKTEQTESVHEEEEREKKGLPALRPEEEGTSITIPEPTIRIIKEEGPGRVEIEEYPPSAPIVPKEESAQPQPKQQAKQGIPYHLVKKDVHDPADWILDCVGGYDFWPEEKGPLPKPELEVEFKKKFPNVTLANFNAIVYDLIYKDKIISEVVDGVTLLRLSAETKAEKAAEWNKRYADAMLMLAQQQAQKQGAPAGERRKEWIEVSPQAELGQGGPWDDLNKQMKDMKWYGRVMTSGPKEIKSLMWHREPPVHEHQPPKAYYPNIMLEWRQSVTGQPPYWHIEGVNIKEEEFMKKIQDKTWSEWLSKNKIVIDVPTWEEAVVKVLEMARSFV
ncbi:MAG: hypothetical protein QXV32_07830 [Conexivisphaerales archaeon]